MSAQFLIATSKVIQDPFHQSIIYLCHHQNHSGGMGLIINKTIADVDLSGVLNHLDIEHQHNHSSSVFMGGPIHADRGIIVYKPAHGKSHNTDVNLSHSKEFLNTIVDGQGPNDFFLALGHTSWKPGQLQSELQDHSWLLYETPSTSIRDELLFFAPIASRYRLACELLGFRPQQLSWQEGRA